MSKSKSEGWRRIRNYAAGKTVLFSYQAVRASDGKKVENHKVLGLLKDFPTEKSQWREVERRGLNALLDRPIGAQPLFKDLAAHWKIYELDKNSGLGKRADETIITIRLVLDNYILPRWEECFALEIKSTQLEQWFESLTTEPQGPLKKPLSWWSVTKIKSVISQIYKHAQRYELIPARLDDGGRVTNPALLARTKTTSDYEAIVVTPAQMRIILNELDTPSTRLEWTLALLHASTGLRPEESFGLKWKDVDFSHGQILIRRGCSKGKETPGKNQNSMTQVVMHSTLAQALDRWRRETFYRNDEDWIFASVFNRGRTPKSAGICSQDYLRPAAVKAGVIPLGYKGRFGWHNLRHSLATFLAGEGVSPAVTQSMLRHKKLSTTMEIYTHSVTSAQEAAQAKFLEAVGLHKTKRAANE